MQEVYRKLSVRSDTDTEMLLPFDDIRQYYGIIEKIEGGIEDASTGDYHNLFCSNDSDR